MFSIEFLNAVRDYEIRKIVPHFSPGAVVLEIGGGTGWQAKQLADRGFAVTSIDVQDSNYRDDKVFTVVVYDGKRFPFDGPTFDLIFSSNVLEHVGDLDQLHRESRRVLKANGYCVHVMPTGVWRFWTSIAHYVEMVQRLGALLPALIPETVHPREILRPLRVLRMAWSILRQYRVPPRHGETGTALSELWTFSTRHWMRHFTSHGFDIIDHQPLGLFYTGHMVLGSRWSNTSREHAAKLLGSACMLFKLRPK
ncbi:MAG: class I SAM-dependent methyltransferase [Nitrospira sp.]